MERMDRYQGNEKRCSPNQSDQGDGGLSRAAELKKNLRRRAVWQVCDGIFSHLLFLVMHMLQKGKNGEQQSLYHPPVLSSAEQSCTQFYVLREVKLVPSIFFLSSIIPVLETTLILLHLRLICDLYPVLSVLILFVINAYSLFLLSFQCFLSITESQFPAINILKYLMFSKKPSFS